MKKLTVSILGLLLAFVLNIESAKAQSSYELLPASSIQITGTSTIHDWECEVEDINFEATLSQNFIQDQQTLQSADFISSLTVSVSVESIESGKGGMNKKIYDALKQGDHPNITYSFTSAELTSSNEGSFTLNASGNLSIAGVTKKVSFPVNGSFTEDGNIRFSGSYSLNMRDYNVDPPSAVFGTIKSGEQVTIIFDIIVSNQTIANN